MLDFVAGQQLGMADPSTVKRYTEREHTRFELQWEIKKDRGYREFDDAEDEFTQWAAATSRATGDGPKAIFADGLAWLRERNILLPGVTTLARLVAKVTTELLGRAQRESGKENARRHPRLARASGRLAIAVEALFESDGWGGPGEEPRVSEVWKTIEVAVSRAELRAALALVTESVPPPGVDDDWRAALPARYPAVSGFQKTLPAVIEFGASAEGSPVLAAVGALPDVLAYRGKLPAPLIPGRLIDAGVVNGPWRRLVFRPPRARGRRGQPARLRLLRTRAVLAEPQAPRHLG